MLEEVKQALRIKSSAFDDEINGLILAAKADMAISGVVIQPEGDQLIRRAVVVYCKANFGLGNAEAEKYQRSYDLLVQHMALCKEYRGDAP